MSKIAATLDGCPTCPFSDATDGDGVHPVVQAAVIGGAVVGALSLGAMVFSAFRPLTVTRAQRSTKRRPRAKLVRVGR